MKRLCFRAAFVLFFGWSSGFASTNPAWLTRVWQTDDGLPDNNVSMVVQGADGYLWIVTPAGLIRFDGESFSPFPIEDFTTWPVPHVRNVLCCRSGALWVASDGGTLIGLNPDFSAIQFSQAELPRRGPHALAESADGSIWLGYTPWIGISNSIYRIKGGKVTCFSKRDGLPEGPFYSMVADGMGNVWAAKGKQLAVFRNGQFQNAASIRAGGACLGATHTNAVWFAAGTHLFKCDTQGTLRDCGLIFQGSADFTVTALLEDSGGAVWIGTDGNGLFRYSASGFERVDVSDSSILSLAEDREGNVWAGTAGGGLDRICSRAIRLETVADNPVSSQLHSIAQDSRGGVWGATEDGMIVSRVDGRWEPRFTNQPFAGTVTCVEADHEDGI
ncbi:MAG TPA: two-component regulator propeller domain-containing protein [Alphaproteobacteria bacterium]|nr:two-component regulator propeller domain-containing protein [Alphaproteobacteria bacterium]